MDNADLIQVIAITALLSAALAWALPAMLRAAWRTLAERLPPRYLREVRAADHEDDGHGRA